MRVLEFKGLVPLQDELSYITVRMGDKWADTEGEAVVIAQRDPDGHLHEVAYAVVEFAYLVNFNSIPDCTLKSAVAKDARSHDGMVESMRRAYGDKFDPEGEVLLLRFNVTGVLEDAWPLWEKANVFGLKEK